MHTLDVKDISLNALPIGVFDSGLGGLTVARAIAQALPHESIYYVGDTKRCPYGTRSEDQVRAFAIQAGRWLEAHAGQDHGDRLQHGDRRRPAPCPAAVLRSGNRRHRAWRPRGNPFNPHAQGGRAGNRAYGALRCLHQGDSRIGRRRGRVRLPASSFVNIVERELATGGAPARAVA